MKKNPVNVAAIVFLCLFILSVILYSLYKSTHPGLVVFLFFFLIVSIIIPIIGLFKRNKYGTSLKLSVFLILAPFIVVGVIYLIASNIHELTIITENRQCTDQDKYLLRDNIKFSYSHGKSIGATELSLWFSECSTNNPDTCKTPYRKNKLTVYPDWAGYENTEYSRVWIHFPKAGFYQIAILKENELLATKLIEVVQSCK